MVWLLLAIAAFFFAAVFYAIFRGRDVRALLKSPFAALSFETEVRKETCYARTRS